LRKQLATAQADLEDVDYNLSIVAMHQRASREGKIGGMRRCASECWTPARSRSTALALIP
jgi:hypothetical protein